MFEQDREGTPQYYGFPANPTVANRQVWNRQELFLAAYAKIGKIGKAAEAAEIPIHTVESWQYKDLHGFKKRTQLAHQAYVESLEQLMDNRLRNPTENRGSDILLMFKLKAEAPEKYREEVKVLGVSEPLQMLDKLRELGAKELKAREALEAPAVEGEFREVEVLGEPPATPSRNPTRPEQPMRASAVETSRASPEPPKKPKKQTGRMTRR